MSPADEPSLQATISALDAFQRKVLGGVVVTMIRHHDRVHEVEWISEQFVSSVALAMAIDLDELRVGDDSIHDILTRLSEHLRAVRSALETDDPVGLSDTLLYDMPEVVGEWRELLDVLRARVSDQAPGQEPGS